MDDSCGISSKMANRMVEMDGQLTMGDRSYVTVNISGFYEEFEILANLWWRGMTVHRTWRRLWANTRDYRLCKHPYWEYYYLDRGHEKHYIPCPCYRRRGKRKFYGHSISFSSLKSKAGSRHVLAMPNIIVLVAQIGRVNLTSFVRNAFNVTHIE